MSVIIVVTVAVWLKPIMAAMLPQRALPSKTRWVSRFASTGEQ